ncbi:hypothetical protein [Pseudaminobacter soli (ex Li et al. 2025)]|uniref:Transcription regulator HTH AraC- type ligand binding domain-containing protein n=1 Tax=Pseudaminobacter soli (ex Li et al. 2025) TaxID=1295366 RepID=A0A2P7SE72_9HYPH|nr:hypothetical protein [Mesorhizobium soli]PSJ60814.1 hypothetical protein C7I85_12290 [Mesorhizobium soli]
MSAPASLPSSVLDTSGLPTKAAISAWQESVSVMFDVRPRQTSDDAFHARVEAFMVGQLALGACSSNAQSFDRSRRRIERDDLDHIVLQFYMRGSCGRRDGSADEKTNPGDLWISDLAMPLATGVTDFDNVNLVVPRRLLAPQLKMPEGHHMSILPGVPLWM